MTRDPVREALVSARELAWLAYVDAPEWGQQEYEAWCRAADAVREHDTRKVRAELSAVVAEFARTTPAASSDAGATPTEGNP